MNKTERKLIGEAIAILERLGQLSAHENIGACRADLIEAHRLLRDAELLWIGNKLNPPSEPK